MHRSWFLRELAKQTILLVIKGMPEEYLKEYGEYSAHKTIRKCQAATVSHRHGIRLASALSSICYTPHTMTPILHILFTLALTLSLSCTQRPPTDTPTPAPSPTPTVSGTAVTAHTSVPQPTPVPTLAPSALSSELPPLEIGQPAPPFALEGLDGNEVSLAALDGKVVVLNFWASWCQPCRLEMPDFQEAWEEHRDQGVVFVGIAVDDLASEASRFAQQVGVTYPLALDATGGAARAYALRGLPSTYFIDREGKLVSKLVGLANQGALRIFLRGQTGLRE